MCCFFVVCFLPCFLLLQFGRFCVFSVLVVGPNGCRSIVNCWFGWLCWLDRFAGVYDTGFLWFTGGGKCLLVGVQGCCGLLVWCMCCGGSEICVCMREVLDNV